MALSKDFSVVGGVATAALVYGVYRVSLPTTADARSMVPNQDMEKSERTATWVSAAVVSGVALVAKDPTIFIIGGTMVVALAWMHRHANAVQPMTGKAVLAAVPRVSQVEAPQNYATPMTQNYGAAI